MQTYIFTVVVQGEDVQDAAEALHEFIIDNLSAVEGLPPEAKVHVTESSRVSD